MATSDDADAGAAVVVASTAVELVTRLYVSAHVERGDFEQLTGPAEALVEAGSQALLHRYFGADFSLGMGLVSAAVTRGWRDADDLVRGVAALPADELAAGLLASTTLDAEDQRVTRQHVDAALADPGERAGAARRIARTNALALDDVEHVLADPGRAHRELGGLLEEAAAAFAAEGRARAVLDAREGDIAEMLAAEGRERALLHLTGGWTLRSGGQRVVLVPTEALGPLVITRLLPDQRILVAFGPRRPEDELTVEHLVAVARALSSDQRLAILRHAARVPASGQTLAKSLGLTQATVHYHTALLRSCGLLTSTRDTHSVLHSVDGAHLVTALTGLARTVLGDDAAPLEPGEC